MNSADKKELRTFTVKAKAIVKRIAVGRDELRALIQEYEEIVESSDNALEVFERALDELSGRL